MPLTHEDWRNIDQRVSNLIKGSHGPYVSQDVVIKNDTLKNVIWVKQFGDYPIPMFTFDYNVKYYDTQSGGLIAKQAVVTPICPNVGDTVLILRQNGSRKLPKCVGVLRSTDFIIQS